MADDRISPEALVQQADALARELLSSPDTVRHSELLALKQANPSLHAMVRSRMDHKKPQK